MDVVPSSTFLILNLSNFLIPVFQVGLSEFVLNVLFLSFLNFALHVDGNPTDLFVLAQFTMIAPADLPSKFTVILWHSGAFISHRSKIIIYVNWKKSWEQKCDLKLVVRLCGVQMFQTGQRLCGRSASKHRSHSCPGRPSDKRFTKTLNICSETQL